MLNIPVKLASAFLLVVAPLAASFALHVADVPPIDCAADR